MNLCLLEERVRKMLGDWWGDVKFAGPGISCPSLSSTEGQRQLPLLFLGEPYPAYLGIGGGDVWSLISREGWLFTGMRLWMHAKVFTYVPQMKSGKRFLVLDPF